MLNQYITKGGKKLRYGYTTGSCAAGAAKAAAMMLFLQRVVTEVEIETPKGWNISLDIHDIEIEEDYVSCCVIKDSGDDPDSTNGIKIYARADRCEGDTVELTGGIGIGKVTKPGLSVAVGESAINPVPRQMILKEVKKVVPSNNGIKIEIYAPQGVELAKKTFNPKLGIVGGISIIGTTGIVEPMSEEALKESLAIELSMLKAQGVKRVIFSPGNYGRDFGITIHIREDILVKTSNFIGFMIDKAVEYEFEEVLWVGHIGKMIKVASGIFDTHSKTADGRMEALAAYCALQGCSQKLVESIMNSITTEEAIDYILSNNMESVFTFIAERISERCEDRARESLKVGTVIFSLKHGLLAVCPTGRRLMEEFKDE